MASVGGLYLLVGSLLGIPRLVWAERTTFKYAFAVAWASLLLPVGFRLHGLLAARPELALQDATFALYQSRVLVPVAVAFMAPLGLAAGRRERGLTVAGMVVPFFAAVLQSLSTESGWGLEFVLIYYWMWLWAGVVIGLPLYLYGRVLQGESPPEKGDPLAAPQTET